MLNIKKICIEYLNNLFIPCCSCIMEVTNLKVTYTSTALW